MYRAAEQKLRGFDDEITDLPGFDHLPGTLQAVVAAHHDEIKAALERARAKNEDPPTLWEIASRYEAEMYQAPTPAERKWLDENAETVKLLVEAAQRSECYFYNPATATKFYWLTSGKREFVDLMLVSGRQLEADGRLDDALDRYLLTLRTIADIWTSDPFLQTEYEIKPNVRRVFLQIANWAGKPGQTPQRLRAAIDRLQSLAPSILRLDEFVKNNFILTHRMIDGAADLRQHYYPSNHPEQMQGEILWDTLMPWESARAARVLNALTSDAMYRFRQIDFVLDRQGEKQEGAGLGQTASEGWYGGWYPGEIESLNHHNHPELYVSELADWIPTTNPDLSKIDQLDREAASQVIYFVAQKRGAMIVLAIQAYRLEHGELPKSLADLQDDYLKHWPLDPYSGQEFRYFPTGAPLGGTEESTSNAAMEIWSRDGGQPIRPGQPGVWGTSQNIIASVSEDNQDNSSEAVNPRTNVKTWRYELRSNWRWPQALPFRDALQDGYWFPFHCRGNSESARRIQ